MVEPIKRTNSTGSSDFDVTFVIPRPKSVVIRFGRAFVVVVESSKKTLELFQHSIEQIAEFIESVRQAIYETTKELFTLDHPSASISFHNAQPNIETRLAPAWKFRVTELRKTKKITTLKTNIQPLLRITQKALSILNGNNPTKSPINTTKYGAGIPNGQNCCFMASVIQALRFSRSFRTRLKDPELRHMPVVQELRQIYTIIEQKKDGSNRNLTPDEINHFRTTCIESGFHIDSDYSQEDSSHFLQFLLSQVGFEDFQTKEHNDHNFGIPVNALDKGLPLTENQVVFQLANSDVSELKDLIQKRKSFVEVEKKHLQKDLHERGLLTDEMQAKLQNLKDIELVPVEQTLQFYRTNLPHVLPLLFERGSYDPITGQTSLNTRKIVPNTYIDFPLADMPGYAARYEWLSAVTREQANTSESSKVINKDSGHYGAWARYDNKGKAIFAQFDSGVARLHTTTADTALDSITQNSRLLVYEYRGIVKA